MCILSCFFVFIFVLVVLVYVDLLFDMCVEFVVIMDGEMGIIFYNKNGDKLMKLVFMIKFMMIVIFFD